MQYMKHSMQLILNPLTPRCIDSIAFRNLNRSFELLSSDTGHCGDSRGWMAAVSQIGMGSCYFGEPVPFFMFANKTNSVLNSTFVFLVHSVFKLTVLIYAMLSFEN